jgi:protein-tyrosine phosphatase
MKKGKVELVTNGLYRGFRPPNYQFLKNMGVQVDVNLEAGFAETFTDEDKSDYETQYGADFGVEEIPLPLSDFKPPREAEILVAVQVIQKKIEEGKTCYVHCLWGKDRTGYVIASFRMLAQGWTYEKAKSEMIDRGFRWWVYWFWLPSLKKFSPK